MSNTLIAEFMGAVVGKKIVAFPDIKLEDNLGIISNNRSFEDLHYHSSWDWLTPVVEKCRLDSRCEHDEDIFWDAIHWALEECSIENTYDAVVRFIKQYNKNK
jgi:hypothetical protein